MRESLSIRERFGIVGWSTTLKQAKLAIFGESGTPASQWDFSSLRQYRPTLAMKLWRGEFLVPRTALITNLYNYLAPPPELGWSLRVSNVRDFRGKSLTYDSHNATDFSVPVGTTVVAAASGTVARIASEFHRGGLKIFIDHGEGLITSYNHLGRALVQIGEGVKRGQPIALSGYSGIDAVVGFPFTPPHVHMNVWLNGVYVDPFGIPGHAALWRSDSAPKPVAMDTIPEPVPPPTRYVDSAVDRAIESFSHIQYRDELRQLPTRLERAVGLLFYMNYFPWLFKERPQIFAGIAQRTPRLDLPFTAAEIDQALFYDEWLESKGQ